MAETDNNQYSGSKSVNMNILGGVPSFYQNLSRYQVSRLLVLQLLTLGAHAQRGLQYMVCKSVRLFGTTYSATTRNKAAKKRYQQVQCHTGLIFKIVIFVKVLRSKVMA